MTVYFITDKNIYELDGIKEIYWNKNVVGSYTGYATIKFFDYINLEQLLKYAQFQYALCEDDRSIYVSTYGMSIITQDEINSKSRILENLKMYHPVRYGLLFPQKNDNTSDDEDGRIVHKRYCNYTDREEIENIWNSYDSLRKILEEEREYRQFQEEIDSEREF